MCVLVGDFGEERIDIVTQIAEAPWPKLVMLGNHDAWTCLTAKRCTSKWDKPLREGPAAAVMQQIDALGSGNLAWNCKAIQGKPVSIVGARPFSKVLGHCFITHTSACVCGMAFAITHSAAKARSQPAPNRCVNRSDCIHVIWHPDVHA
jgi:uncharacterized protein (TIGR04168 family)